MLRTIFAFSLLLVLVTLPALGQDATEQQLKNGVNFMDTNRFHTEAEDSALLAKFKGLRVADVSDGMDKVGLPNVGLVNPEIHAEWEDHKNMSHIIRGIALTVRYVPTQRSPMPPEDMSFDEWVGNFYGSYSSEPFKKIIHDGHVIVIDDANEHDIGSIGSNNIMRWVLRGAEGVVTDASSRDTDEIAKEGIPLYLRDKGRGIRPGRNELESVNKPIVVGGVTVQPGDVIIADGDGVIVVPREVAPEVAEYAHQVLKQDKAARRSLYKKLGIPLDQTVKD